jgi:hypothetical protein
MMPFTGSCHCGLVAYEVAEEPPTEAMECNCSICRRRAALHHFTTPDKFDLKTSRDALTTYKWNKQNLALHFCKECGCAPFAEGQGPNGPMVEINLRCAEDIDLDSLKINKFDGAHKIPGPVG